MLSRLSQVLHMPPINHARSDACVAWGLKNQYGSVLMSMTLLHTMALRLVWDPGGQQQELWEASGFQGDLSFPIWI